MQGCRQRGARIGQILYWTDHFLDKWIWVLCNLLFTCIAHTLEKNFHIDMKFFHKYNFWRRSRICYYFLDPDREVNQSIEISQKLPCLLR